MVIVRLQQVILSIALSVFIVAPARAEMANELTGRAVVVDGDTLEIEGKTVNLFGIDAPEFVQFCEMDQFALPCGQRVATFLAVHIGDRVVHCSRHESSQINGLFAVCKVGDEDLAQWLVSNGHALAYRKYSDDYVSAEREARERRSNLWRWPRSFVPPWQWREQHAYVPKGVAADVDDRMRAPVRRVIELLLDKDYHQLARLGVADDLSRESHISQVEEAIATDRHTLIMPPEAGFERMTGLHPSGWTGKKAVN
jgi:endonuclease YncB( thermonuclease family)